MPVREPQTWADRDDLPATHGAAFSSIAADIDLRTQPGAPRAPTAYVILQNLHAVDSENVTLRWASGADETFVVPAGALAMVVRGAFIRVLFAGIGADIRVSAAWSYSANMNPPPP